MQAVGVYWFGDGVRDLITFGILILVLVFRPSGLFGKAQRHRPEPLTGTFLGGGRPIRLPWWGSLIALAAAAALPFVFSGYVAGIGTQVLIYAIAAVGLTIIAGSAGQIILGSAGPIAIGAYTSALLVVDLEWPFALSLLSGGVLAAVVSGLLTFPVWKLSGHYVAIATIGVGAITVAIIRNWESLTRGSYGLTGIPFPELFGRVIYSSEGIYLLDLAVLAIALIVVGRIHDAHLGKVFAAIGSDVVAAESSGVRASGYKALAYAISAFFAGLAGALMAHQYTYLDPSMFPLPMSLLVLTIIVLGGLNSPLGAVIGAIVLVGAPELLRVVPEWRIIGYGVLLIAVIRFRPQGIFVRK